MAASGDKIANRTARFGDAADRSRLQSRLTVASLVVAVVALAVAIWALVSALSGGPSVSAADAKTQVCDGFQMVRSAVSLQTNADLGQELVAVQAVAANARLATLGGGQFLLARLNDKVPNELADAVRTFATNLENIGMGQLAGTAGDDPVQATRMNDAQAASTRIAELCK